MINKLKYDHYLLGDDEEKVIVAIHGWQGDRNSMQPLMNSIKIEHVGWYFLEAPYNVPDGKGKSWSYKHPDGSWEIDEPKRMLIDFFKELFQKYVSKNIYVLGFSQGGMVCFDFILHLDSTLGGIFPICGFFRKPELDQKRFNLSQINTPIYIGHAKNDDIVPLESSLIAYKVLKSQGANVDMFIYNGRHKIGLEYLKKIRNIIING